MSLRIGFYRTINEALGIPEEEKPNMEDQEERQAEVIAHFLWGWMRGRGFMPDVRRFGEFQEGVEEALAFWVAFAGLFLPHPVK